MVEERQGEWGEKKGRGKREVGAVVKGGVDLQAGPRGHLTRLAPWPCGPAAGSSCSSGRVAVQVSKGLLGYPELGSHAGVYKERSCSGGAEAGLRRGMGEAAATGQPGSGHEDVGEKQVLVAKAQDPPRHTQCCSLE